MFAVVQLLRRILLFATRDPMDYSTPGSPIPYYHPEFAQIHVHWVGDII